MRGDYWRDRPEAAVERIAELEAQLQATQKERDAAENELKMLGQAERIKRGSALIAMAERDRRLDAEMQREATDLVYVKVCEENRALRAKLQNANDPH